MLQIARTSSEHVRNDTIGGQGMNEFKYLENQQQQVLPIFTRLINECTLHTHTHTFTLFNVNNDLRKKTPSDNDQFT